MKQATTDPGYAALLADVSRLYEEHSALFVPPADADRQRVQVYWHMGRRIVDVVQKGQERGAYGKKVIAQLSRDLCARYDRGFRESTVRNIRRFALQYAQTELRSDLSWSQYRVLMTVAEADTRRELEARAVAERLSKEQLRALVAQVSRRSKEGVPFPLSPRVATPGIDKVVLDGSGEGPLLDLGFCVVRRLPLRGVAHPVNGEYVIRRGDRFARVSCADGERHVYQAKLLRVIDGDTVRLRMDLGFDTFVEETLRLRGVDADEIDTPSGQKARRALVRILPEAADITVYTYSHDRYGRYIADLIVDDLYINRALVEKGVARYLKM